MLRHLSLVILLMSVVVLAQAPAPQKKGTEPARISVEIPGTVKVSGDVSVKELPQVIVEVRKLPDAPTTPERPWGKWIWDEAGGAYVSAFLSFIVGGATCYLVWKQIAIAKRQNEIQEAMKTLQTDMNDHQKQMDARQNLEAEGKLYIPLYLKVLSNNRQWQYLMTEREESVRRSIKEAEQRVRAAGHPSFTDEDVKNVGNAARGSFTKANANGLDAAVRSLFQDVESLCYLIHKGWVEDAEFLATMTENFDDWRMAYDEFLLYEASDSSDPHPYFHKLSDRYIATGSAANRTTPGVALVSNR